ncbi:MAG TPA: hypothetical protein DCM40_08385, partial [Maribacter sp.]|nr:hypothetical protein [Maribacter sp.]
MIAEDALMPNKTLYTNLQYVVAQSTSVFKSINLLGPGVTISSQQVINDFAKTDEWKSLFDYALPQGLANGVVSAYAFLNLLAATNNKKTF